MEKKAKYKYSEIHEIGQELLLLLMPYCDQIVLSGSLRRKYANRANETVGDIEIVAVPKQIPLGVDLFSRQTGSYDALHKYLEDQMDKGDWALRMNKNGKRIAFGAKNKCLLYKGYPVDIFTASEKSFVAVHFVRTGSADHNIKIFSRAKQMGLKFDWQEGVIKNLATHKETTITSEEQIFKLLGLPYKAPAHRL